jgi:FAD/FMN-containing dehydrogenase
MAVPPYEIVRTFENFGHSLGSSAFYYQPEHEDDIHQVLKTAKQSGLTVTVRGAGRSYNDAALNGGGSSSGSISCQPAGGPRWSQAP